MRAFCTLFLLWLGSTVACISGVVAASADEPHSEHEKRARAWKRLVETGAEPTGKIPEKLKSIAWRPEYDDSAAQKWEYPTVQDDDLKLLQVFPELESVLIQETAITDKGLGALADLPFLQQVHIRGSRVAAEAPGITDKGIASLSRLTNLRAITIGWIPVTDAGLGRLKNIANLKSLELIRLPISDKAFDDLSALGQLEELSLTLDQVTSTGVAKLVSATPKLRSLKMERLTVDPILTDAIAKRNTLTHLSLRHCTITGGQLAFLTNLKNLTKLDLEFTNIDERALAPVFSLKNLKYAEFPSGVSYDAVLRLRKALPDAIISGYQ